MADEPVKYSQEAGVATITLNRPEKYNTLRIDLLDALNAALARANRDDDVRVIVLEGAGDSFCGGFDFSGSLDHFGTYRGTICMMVFRDNQHGCFGISMMRCLGHRSCGFSNSYNLVGRAWSGE